MVCLAAPRAAAAQDPTGDLPVSIDRIRDDLARPPAIRLPAKAPTPIPTFKSRVDQHVFVLPLKEWLAKEFDLTPMQRQSAEWAAAYRQGIRFDLLIDYIADARRHRQERQIRQQIARELAEIELARRKPAER